MATGDPGQRRSMRMNKKFQPFNPRVNQKGGFSGGPADQRRPDFTTVDTNPAGRGGPSPVVASALQSIADQALLGQAARPVTTDRVARGIASAGDAGMLASARREPAVGPNLVDRVLLQQAQRPVTTGFADAADRAMRASATRSPSTTGASAAADKAD